MSTLFSKGLRPGLYAITDNTLTPPNQLVSAVESAILGGAVLVQYRDKISTDIERLRQAADLQSLCQSAGVPLIINDDPELAKRVGAAGVHLGQSDRSLTEARQLLGNQAIIGLTCHDSIELARQADRTGADYLAFGRFFHSGTKPEAPPANKQVLAQARQFQRPITAIGGINADNGAELICSGADLLAVVGGLFGHQDIEFQARRLSQLFSDHHPLFHSHS
ncbi:thiamine phosphate synthase [Marinobacter zhejiangensis]|uniref:Thiamine-phosphate synthase n=1 Tax=Marinobacter zhejiangensis TaxID=488535 RepID=A0A1I4MIZ1_9GAMM|nr:thiamine phosphate synthase [Marinobacter zhejiangensis]SFM03179.1 thiamine-phosphate diphosphorylase [Marinobacter zhejiangensis]